MELEKLRRKIDDVDKEILLAIAKRQEIVKQIGVFKKQKGLTPKDATRWQQVISSRKKLASELDIPKSVVLTIWDILHEWSLEVEARQDD